MFNPSELCHCTSDNVLLLISIINLLFWSFFLVWELFLSSAYFFLICTEFWNVNKRELQKTFFFFFSKSYNKASVLADHIPGTLFHLGSFGLWLVLFVRPICFHRFQLPRRRFRVMRLRQREGADPVMLRLTALICIIRRAYAKEQSFNSVWQ